VRRKGMNDDLLVEKLKAKWGIQCLPPPKVMLGVDAAAFYHLIASAFDAVGVGRGYALALGDGGTPLVTELDRCSRHMKTALTDVVP
jgi:hypothetical protein